MYVPVTPFLGVRSAASRATVALLLTATTLAAQDTCLPLAEFEPLGTGTRGAAGIPGLQVLGLPALDQPGVGVRLVHGAPQAVAQVLFSSSVGPTQLPAMGATLWPAAPLGRWVTALDAQGASPPLHSGPAAPPATLCGLDFFVQGLVLDATAQGGAAFTPGLRLHFGAGSTAAGLFAQPRSLVVPDVLFPAKPDLAVGDLDGNGRPDLVIPAGNGQHAGVRVLRQLTDGTLAPPIVTPLLLLHHDLDLADVNGDGRLDVIAMAEVSGAVAALVVLPGLGDGTLGAPQATPAPPGLPAALAAGDVTGDGRTDVVLATESPSAVALYAGAPGGGFETPHLVPLPELKYVRHVRLADVNGDGLRDVLLFNGGPSAATSGATLVVLESAGAAGLAAPGFQPVFGEGDGDFDVGDLDGDGWPDVALPASTETGAAVLVRLNDGTGGFPTAVTSAAPEPASDIEDLRLADLDADGTPEVLLATPWDSFRLEHVGNGKLGEAVSLGEPARRLDPTDMDGDGRLDLALLTDESFASYASWRAGAGDGTLVALPVLADLPATVARAVDLDGDGALDLAGRLAGGTLAVALHVDHAGYGPATGYDAGGSVRRLDAGDLDLDGAPDVAVCHTGAPGVALLRGLGDGTLAAPVPGTVGGFLHDLRLADFDLDGRPDIVVSQGSSAVLQTFPVLPNATLGPPVSSAAGVLANVQRFAVGDVDGDGALDVLATGQNALLLFHGTGTLAPDAPVSLPEAGLLSQSKSLAIEMADLDADGDADLVYHVAFSETRLRLNDGAGGLLPAPLSWGYAEDELALVDVNGDGSRDIVGRGVWLGLGDGSFAAFQPGAVQGVAADLDGDGDTDVFGLGRVFFNALFD
jgi:hypothetical protein